MAEGAMPIVSITIVGSGGTGAADIRASDKPFR